jgi:2'-5' RNA ligase
MRLFLAINPPVEVRRDIWNATAAMREAAPFISWVGEPRIHLTLKFLGEQPETVVAPLTEALVAIGKSHAVLALHVGGIGAFSSFHRPKVVWIGLDPEPRLELLHHDVEVACDKLGHQIEGRPFRPHLTLGRVKDKGTTDELRALRAAAAKVRFNDEFAVRSVDMMQSTSSPAGQVYTTLATARMRGA